MRVLYKFFDVKPIVAEHPIGSGIVVEYTPGMEVPASEWGRAADNLVELGKIVRVAFNVPDDESESLPLAAYVPDHPVSAEGVQEFYDKTLALHVTQETEPESDGEYPIAQGFGWYLASDGNKVRGKEAALEYEESLGV